MGNIFLSKKHFSLIEPGNDLIQSYIVFLCINYLPPSTVNQLFTQLSNFCQNKLKKDLMLNVNGHGFTHSNLSVEGQRL